MPLRGYAFVATLLKPGFLNTAPDILQISRRRRTLAVQVNTVDFNSMKHQVR
jgi:hypothetical protein